MIARTELFFVLFVITFMHYCIALDCYRCQKTKDCDDPFNAQEEMEHECNDFIGDKICFKYVNSYGPNHDLETYRGCDFRDVEELCEHINLTNQYYGRTLEVCVACTDDLCNDASHFSITLLSIPVVFFISVLLTA
ncbi:hypothetical protein B566_EDAN001556 [Ephemera danica]|nr:hypothetical protein B566_EDAN001556 [Ephemera danica]